MNPIAPCKDCTKRYIGCHAKCQEYLTFKKQMDKYNETIHHSHGYNFVSNKNKKDNLEE